MLPAMRASRALRLLQQPGELNPAQCEASTQPRLYFCRGITTAKCLSCLCIRTMEVEKCHNFETILTAAQYHWKESIPNGTRMQVYCIFFFLLLVSSTAENQPESSGVWSLSRLVCVCRLFVELKVVKLSYIAYYFKLRLFPTWGEIKTCWNLCKEKKARLFKQFPISPLCDGFS